MVVCYSFEHIMSRKFELSHVVIYIINPYIDSYIKLHTFGYFTYWCPTYSLFHSLYNVLFKTCDARIRLWKRNEDKASRNWLLWDTTLQIRTKTSARELKKKKTTIKCFCWWEIWDCAWREGRIATIKEQGSQQGDHNEEETNKNAEKLVNHKSLGGELDKNK